MPQPRSSILPQARHPGPSVWLKGSWEDQRQAEKKDSQERRGCRTGRRLSCRQSQETKGISKLQLGPGAETISCQGWGTGKDR